MADVKPLGFDNEAYEVMSKAILALFAEFIEVAKVADPVEYKDLIEEGIYFGELNENSGYSFEGTGGAAIITRKTSITGKIHDSLQYPIVFIRRTASVKERQKLKVDTFLDTLGKWVCMEDVMINGQTYRLKEYPKLTNGRKITEVWRNNSVSQDPNANGVQDWGLPLYIYYTHEYYKNK